MPFPRRNKRAFCGKIFDTFRFLHVLFSCQCSARLPHSVKAHASLPGRFIALGLSSSCLHISPSVGGVCRVFTRSARPPALSSSSFLHFPSFCDPPCCRSRLPPHAPCRLRLCVAICLAAALLSSSSCLHSFPPFFGIKRARSLSGPRSAFAQALIIPAYRSPPFRTEICSSARGWNATA